MKLILVNTYWYTCWLKHSSRLILYFDFIHHLDYTFYIILLYWLRARITGVILIDLQFFFYLIINILEKGPYGLDDQNIYFGLILKFRSYGIQK